MAIRVKFGKLKEEVDSDLSAFAGDLVGILEKTSGSHPEWRESLEDLLIVARQCAMMSPSDFWLKCETIVQNLDDRRQELPMGILRQAHTRILFILSRCTRLVQFQKESGYEQDHILGLHQLSDLGVYPEQVLQAVRQQSIVPPDEHEMVEKLQKPHGKEQENLKINQSQVSQHVSTASDSVDDSTAKSAESSTGSYKMSSWKKFKSPAEKKCSKGQDSGDLPSKEELNQVKVKDENAENLDTPSCNLEQSESSSRTQKVTWGFWGDHHNLTYENSMICRICEVEIPIVHVEEHSQICTIADRCDLKGLTVNERLERVAETIERIIESLTPKSTPKSTDGPGESFETARVSTSSMQEDFNELSLERNSFSCRSSVDILDSAREVDNSFVKDDLNLLPKISCKIQSCFKLDQGTKVSSVGTLTPRSPLLTPRTSQIEMLVSGRRTIFELENYSQVCIVI